MPSLADLAELVRAPAALSVPGDVVAGAAAAGTLDRRVLGLAGASVLIYWAGMAANDWADRELDARERPERPIPSGRVSPGLALGVSAGLTVAGVALACLTGGRRALAAAVPLAGAVWAYDLAAKNTAAGPGVMAACRGLDVLLGASRGRAVRAVPAALTVAAHTYTVTVLSRREVSGASRTLPAATMAGTAAVAAAVVAGRRIRTDRPIRHGTAGRYGSAVPSGPTDRHGPAVPSGSTGQDGSVVRSGPIGRLRSAARNGSIARSGWAVRGGWAGRLGPARRNGSGAGTDWRALVPVALVGWYGLQYGAAQARVAVDPQAARVRAAVGAGITGLPALQGALVARSGAAVLGVAVAAAAPLGRRLARKVSPT